MIHKVHTI